MGEPLICAGSLPQMIEFKTVGKEEASHRIPSPGSPPIEFSTMVLFVISGEEEYLHWIPGPMVSEIRLFVIVGEDS